MGSKHKNCGPGSVGAAGPVDAGEADSVGAYDIRNDPFAQIPIGQGNNVLDELRARALPQKHGVDLVKAPRMKLSTDDIAISLQHVAKNRNAANNGK